MGRARFLIIVLVAAAVIGGLMSVFTVSERQQAIVLEFGRFKETVTQPGIHFIPPWYSVQYYDRRVLDYDVEASEIPTSDQKQVVVDTFARYRIIDPLKFFQTARTMPQFEQNLKSIVVSNVAAVFGQVDMLTLLTPRRAELMGQIATRVGQQAEAFGVEIVDVRVKRLDLPTQNSEAIFRRMETQRRQEATRIRAEGERDAKRVRADADKQSRVIAADAERRAQILRGEGEGQAQEIYNKAFGQDPEFFEFWLSMNVLRDTMKKEDTRYVGPARGEVFKYFGSMTGEPEKR